MNSNMKIKENYLVLKLINSADLLIFPLCCSDEEQEKKIEIFQ